MTIEVDPKEFGYSQTMARLNIKGQLTFKSPYDQHFFGNQGAGGGDSEKEEDASASHHYIVNHKKRKDTPKHTKNPTLQPKSITGMRFFGESPNWKVAMNELFPKIVAIFASKQSGGGLNAFNFGNLPTFGGSMNLQSLVGAVMNNGGAIDQASALMSHVQDVASQIGSVLGASPTSIIDVSNPSQMIPFMQAASMAFGGNPQQSSFSLDHLADGVAQAQQVQQYLMQTLKGGPVYNELLTTYSGFKGGQSIMLPGFITQGDAQNVLDLLSLSSVQNIIGDMNVVMKMVSQAQNIVNGVDMDHPAIVGFGSVNSINVISGGTDYTNADYIEISGGTMSAMGNVVTDNTGVITSITMTSNGYGFTSNTPDNLHITSTYGTSANIVYTVNTASPPAASGGGDGGGGGISQLAGQLMGLMGQLQNLMQNNPEQKAKHKVAVEKKPQVPFQGKHPQEEKKDKYPYEEDTGYNGQNDPPTPTPRPADLGGGGGDTPAPVPTPTPRPSGLGTDTGVINV